MGLVLFENREVSPKPQLDLKEAAALTQSLKLTKDQTRKMKSYLSSKGVFFPNTNDLLEARKRLHPTISPELNGDGDQTTTSSLLKWLHLWSMFWIKTVRLISPSHTMLYTKMTEMVLVHKPFGKQNKWTMLQTTFSNIALPHFVSSNILSSFMGKSYS